MSVSDFARKVRQCPKCRGRVAILGSISREDRLLIENGALSHINDPTPRYMRGYFDLVVVGGGVDLDFHDVTSLIRDAGLVYGKDQPKRLTGFKTRRVRAGIETIFITGRKPHVSRSQAKG